MKNLSKVMAVAFMAMFCFASCKKSSNNNTSVSPNTIVLSPLQVSGNLVTLKWSKLNSDSLTGYMILKVTDSNNQQFTDYKMVDKTITQYVDTLPLAPYVQYYIVAQNSTSSYYPVTSNKETYARNDINFMAIQTKDVIYDKDNHALFLYSAGGDIIRYDVPGKQISRQIATQATIGYCDLGIYNGTKELYVPRTDGWLFIYNAATLDQIDQINVGGQLSDVAYSGGNLYISSMSNSNIFVYNRASKALVSQTYSISNYDGRLKLVPGTNSEFFGVSSSSDVAYYKFASNGTYISSQNNYLSSTYLSSAIFEVFPSGNFFISSAAGVIVKKDLTYAVSLPHGNINFTSFFLDEANQVIYAGCDTRAIQTYSMSNYQLTKTVATKAYPVKVFYDNGSIISVERSTPYYNYTTMYTFIEQL